MDRKQFIKGTSAALVLASLGISLSGCESDEVLPANPDQPIEIDLSVDPFSELTADGAWLLHPTENILLVNVNGNISALTSVCTHSGCSRDWRLAGDEFVCTCHGSSFNFNGNVVQGPATRGLSKFTVTVEGQKLTLS